MAASEPDQELTRLVHGMMPFAAALDLEILEGSADGVRARGQWSAERCTGGNVLHGGYLMALADSVGALCAGLNLPQGATTSTIESKTNFLRAVTGGTVEISASAIHVGRRTIVVQTDITRDDGKLATRTTQTQSVIAPPG